MRVPGVDHTAGAARHAVSPSDSKRRCRSRVGKPAFKAFQEASSHAVMIKGLGWKNKIAAGFTNSGSRSGDKLATLIEIALFAAQHGMHWVNLGLPPGNHSTKGSENDLNRLGFWLGAGAQSNTDQGPDRAPPEADLRTAEHLGRRVAETTLQWVRGRHARSCLDEREKLYSDVEMCAPAAS